jgi:hypothetical protein
VTNVAVVKSCFLFCRSELLKLLRSGHLDDLDLDLEEETREKTGLMDKFTNVFKLSK